MTSYEYDAAGNRRFKTDGNGQRTEYVYDANRRLTQVLFPDGTSYEYAYDARGNRTLERSEGHERVLGYDALGRLARVEDQQVGAPAEARRVVTYGYDAAGQRRRMVIDTGEAVEYRWDAAGRLLETIDPQGETTRFGYDAAGRRTSATYGNGTRATWGYDAVGQVLSIAYLDGAGGVQTAFGYGYDEAGNRTRKVFADGTKEEYGYDRLNRLVRARYATDRLVEYEYDGVGNRVSMLDTGKGKTTRWAVSATASSSAYSTPGNATGAPDELRWTPSTSSGSWLEVSFGTAERASGVRVHEVGGAPFVMRVGLVDEGGAAPTVFAGGDGTKNGGWLVIPLGVTAYRVVKAKLYTAGSGGTENVDAVVELILFRGVRAALWVKPQGASFRS